MSRRTRRPPPPVVDRYGAPVRVRPRTQVEANAAGQTSSKLKVWKADDPLQAEREKWRKMTAQERYNAAITEHVKRFKKLNSNEDRLWQLHETSLNAFRLNNALRSRLKFRDANGVGWIIRPRPGRIAEVELDQAMSKLAPNVVGGDVLVDDWHRDPIFAFLQDHRLKKTE